MKKKYGKSEWKEFRNEVLVRIEGGIPITDRFLVFVNRWSSDFGQNWFLPLFWITITTGMHYFVIDQPELSLCPRNIGTGILEALSYLNPVRKIDLNMSKSNQGLDVLFRIINTYFIYHFIKASRKFGKV